MKCKLLQISEPFFRQIISGGIHNPYEVIEDGLPEDAEIIDCRFNAFNYGKGNGIIEILFYSEAFPEIKEGEGFPLLNPVFKKISNEVEIQ